jgi:hypothetical protein
MKRLLGLHIEWVGWAAAFTAEFVVLHRWVDIGGMRGCWTLWLGPLLIRRRVGGNW